MATMCVATNYNGCQERYTTCPHESYIAVGKANDKLYIKIL